MIARLQLLIVLFVFFLVGFPSIATSQLLDEKPSFTRADTLRGSITPERAWWEVVYYDLHVNVTPSDSTIQGYNNITYRVTDTPREMQIDLQRPLTIDYIIQDEEKIPFRREGNAFFLEMPDHLKQGHLYTVTVYYQGKPQVAENAPWDGGFVWTTDSYDTPWIATANQGLGASVWWPNKDHQTAEPDSMQIAITVPNDIKNVSNGRLRKATPHQNGTTTYTWFVDNPINNYNVAVNAGNYVSFSDTLHGEKGVLDLNYWVLEPNLTKAQKQFVQVKPMMRCFESWFGPYPFYEDSFKLVETPHLGMEHQSAVAYGNEYQNGYKGTDLSGTGWGLLWDFIIIHESGHEWFGNNITTKDIADMWVHEGFTNYSESIYTECIYGKQAGAAYVIGLRNNIQNDRPIVGYYGVNHEGSGDMYYKGSNMLHTIRQIVNNDQQWRAILRGMNEEFGHQTVTGTRIEQYLSAQSGKDLSKVFDQYLRTTDIPKLQYVIDDNELWFRWTHSVDNFNMPIKVMLDNQSYSWIHPTTDWQKSEHTLQNVAQFSVDKNFYVQTEQLDQKLE
ncbi:MAG: M1 family metallopeptidase [Bacteroidota bacterium]